MRPVRPPMIARMWKRRAEIAVLALLVVIAGGVGDGPHVHVAAPELDLTGLMPDRVDGPADIGMVALAVAVDLLD